MENKIPLLSICIPTYNREKYLQECLESIIHQEGFNTDDIEIVISDNASQDGTTKLVESYKEKYPNIQYFRNAENIGAIRNVLGLPSLARGEYVWYMSDDDMFSDIAFSTILPLLREGSADFLLSRFYGFWNGERIDTQKIHREGDIIHLTGMTQFFGFLEKVPYDITSYLMLLSIFCFRRTVFASHLSGLLEEQGSSYIETLSLDNFIHARIMYMLFGEEKKITVIERDLVLCRGDNISWSFRFVVCDDLRRLIQDMNRTYTISRKTYKKMKHVYHYAIFSYIVMVHVKKYLPKFLYDFCVQVGRKFFALIRYVRMKISSK